MARQELDNKANVLRGENTLGTVRPYPRQTGVRQTSVTTYIAPDILLPEQFYDALRNVHQGPWLITLMRAMLDDAIQCFCQGVGSSQRNAQRLASEAEAWLFTNDAQWPLSFLNVCNLLQLEPQYIQSGLRHWAARRHTEPWRKHRRVTRADIGDNRKVSVAEQGASAPQGKEPQPRHTGGKRRQYALVTAAPHHLHYASK